MSSARLGRSMEIAKRGAHIAASLGGFKTVPSYDKVFPQSRKPGRTKKSDFGKFFGRLKGPDKRKE